jgi:hypothetical protein
VQPRCCTNMWYQSRSFLEAYDGAAACRGVVQRAHGGMEVLCDGGGRGGPAWWRRGCGGAACLGGEKTELLGTPDRPR